MSIEGAEGGRYYTPGAAYIVRSWFFRSSAEYSKKNWTKYTVRDLNES